MRMPTVIIIILIILSCGNSDQQVYKSISKPVLIPDTTNNWFVKLYDYNYYLRKKEIEKQLNLANLETDTNNVEIRVWIMASNYNPQNIYFLENKNKAWTI
jgi:hypothetical protein